MRPSHRPTALALLISAAATGTLTLWAVAAAPDTVRTPLAWGAGAAAVLLSVCVAVTVHTLGTARTLRTLRAADAQRFTSETSRLVSASAVEAQRFTAETARIKGAASAETARLVAEARAENERIVAAAAAEQSRLQVSVDRLAARATRAETERSAAVAACANAAGRMQALSTSMLADLREMEHRHTDESVLGDLLHLDHRTAQAGRLADSIAVLTGARSGRRWAKPIVMESILRGAMGRIGSYQRVRLHSTSDVAIAGHAAEGVMHALAELLDNAANFSPPTAEVHVYVEEVPAGIVITVEDSGLVMSEVQLRRAERAVSADHQDLTNLSGTRLGLAVVGRLARKHGLTVSFRPSARGGTGALMMLPQELISRAVAPAPAAPATAAPAASVAASAPTPPAAAPAPADTAPAVELPAEPEPAHASAAGTDAAADAARLPRTRTEDDASTPLTPAAEADSPGSPVSSADSVSESTGSVPEFGESGLPKRRRGRTLAAAEARTGNAAPGEADTPRARTTDPKVQAARFSTFSKAVRANSSHPEGNTR
ncbi:MULTISPECIES: sensor histidine kinase [Streptomyces]|uniref:histidine kinase n=1 Tax=Streptomyces rubiginosohelvolus TaxID=67362 RepID=A0ABQ3BFV5_9ACTN|nr:MULTISPECIES: ATP-binding protein [Streptomyces]RUP69411.1 sensory histidine kinase CreC [Streptomyces sp. NP10]GGR76633.1 histidine kinase [Streptomyces rubiginosohelvolus]GGZ40391.1 histidine kinase [Streptomyces pluricolorescens]